MSRSKPRENDHRDVGAALASEASKRGIPVEELIAGIKTNMIPRQIRFTPELEADILKESKLREMTFSEVVRDRCAPMIKVKNAKG